MCGAITQAHRGDITCKMCIMYRVRVIRSKRIGEGQDGHTKFAVELLPRIDDLIPLAICTFCQADVTDAVTADLPALCVKFLYLIGIHVVCGADIVIDNIRRARETILLHDRERSGEDSFTTVIERQDDRFGRQFRSLSDRLDKQFNGDGLIPPFVQKIHLLFKVIWGDVVGTVAG